MEPVAQKWERTGIEPIAAQQVDHIIISIEYGVSPAQFLHQFAHTLLNVVVQLFAGLGRPGIYCMLAVVKNKLRVHKLALGKLSQRYGGGLGGLGWAPGQQARDFVYVNAGQAIP